VCAVVPLSGNVFLQQLWDQIPWAGPGRATGRNILRSLDEAVRREGYQRHHPRQLGVEDAEAMFMGERTSPAGSQAANR
jgi:hypothetical protein